MMVRANREREREREASITSTESREGTRIGYA